ncbi:hypothetical protein PG993_009905 [Apiospora rasikravindrae]|uniref:Secreted protein n=1 Tax=Apiospora rasikravindrae TaxID=990691 RepID=A0ABR1SMH7_9PEZI
MATTAAAAAAVTATATATAAARGTNPSAAPPTNSAVPPVCGVRGGAACLGLEAGVAAAVTFVQRAAVRAEYQGLDEGRDDEAG